MEIFRIGFLDLRLLDILDILIVSFLLFRLYQLLKGSAAMNIFLGILAIYGAWWLFGKVLHMQLLGSILGQFISIGVLALIIVFQQEIRRFLLLLGSNSFTGKDSWSRRFFPKGWKIEQSRSNLQTTPIVKACASMSKSKTGAIIILVRGTDLKFYENTGDLMDAEVSKRLLESIFFKNSPLHDGAVIIENNKIKAARCVLPVTENTELPAQYGMRHRAALGITEQTDAISVIVSEETGHIAMAIDGTLYPNLSPEELEKMLQKEF